MKKEIKVPTMKRRLERVQLIANAPTKTQQHMKNETDINSIMQRFQSTGQLPTMIKNNPQYGDFSEPRDYQESLNVVLHAQEQFAALPSRVRERFSNDPYRFLEFTADPKNIDEMISMGLATKREQLNERDTEKPNKKNREDSKKSDPQAGSQE